MILTLCNFVKSILVCIAALVPFAMAEEAERFAVDEAEATALLETLRKNMSHMVTLACRFRQEKHLEMFEDVIRFEGWCYLHKPNQIRWEYSEPLKKIIVLKQDKIAVYKVVSPESKKEIATQEHEYLKTVYGYIMAFFQGNFVVHDKNFQFSVEKSKKGEYFLLLKGQHKLQKFIARIVMKIATNHKEIQEVFIYEPGGDYTYIHFHSFVVNPQFVSDLFLGKLIGNFADGFQR
jgi:outer membrane lipoprotein carrier protein